MDYWKELATKHARELWRVVTKHARELWRVITKRARELWRAISDARRAPLIVAVTISGIIISGILYAAFSWAYQTAMIQKDAAINGQQITIADLNSTIADLKAENADLRSKLSAKPAQSIETPKNSPNRDPDGIFSKLARLLALRQIEKILPFFLRIFFQKGISIPILTSNTETLFCMSKRWVPLYPVN